MKANSIYLRRLRDKDFVDRVEEDFEFRPTTMQDVANACMAINKFLEEIRYKNFISNETSINRKETD